MKLQLQDLSDSEFSLMHDSILKLLREYGVLFEHEAAQALLERAGNEADHDGRVHLRPSFVESMLELNLAS
jgi:trimethylamine:corrinoid methyltransferase-like protein